MLRSVRIYGLRGFTTEQTLRVAEPNGTTGSGLTYLTGPNNSGKSTIIECFSTYLWQQLKPTFHEGMRNKKTNEVEINFEHQGRTDTIKSLRRGSSQTETSYPAGTVLPYVIPSRRYFAPYFGRQPVNFNRATFLMRFGDQNVAQQRGPTLNLFEVRLFDIDADENKRKAFNEIIERIIPRGVNWTIDQMENNQYVLRFLGNEKAHSAEGVGEGIASLFTLVAALYDSANGDIIVIDEPELSLHPTFQKRLSAVISDFAATRQIIVSTHSPYMIEEKAINNGATLCRTWERQDGTEIKQLNNAAREAWRRLTNRANLNNPHRFGLNAKEVFFLDDGVIVGESQEDVVLLPAVFEAVDATVNAEFFGWGAGGAENIRHVCSILDSLGFLKVAAIFDNDKRHEMEQVRAAFPNYFVTCIPADDVRSKPAAQAREAKRGLLRNDRTIDPEYEGATMQLVGELVTFLRPEELGDGAQGHAANG